MARASKYYDVNAIIARRRAAKAAGKNRIDLSVLNAPEVVARLRALSRVMEKKIVADAGKAAMTQLLPLGQAKAPKLSGRLSRSLFVGMHRYGRRSKLRGTINVRLYTGRKRALGIPEAERFYYPASVEWGYVRNRRKSALVRRGYQAPASHAWKRIPGTHWMRDLLRANEPTILANVRRAIEAGLNDAERDINVELAASGASDAVIGSGFE